ncbi:recombinase family protein [Phreatobacter cathodiphilus]|uniref:Resolvase n=1 Tax=Phreatobacter cathodiphilus TaxID=1868589 RepID=A0A2S0NFF9_9HYPH|nr:recombinase family protein [Phreatobacter cathodiphilus]AVO46633.1 resolvase [Phreatobacter cathodiphilus]
MTVYGYLRVSTARQADEGHSLEVQRRQIEGYALMKGLVVEQWVVEEGVSGAIPVAKRTLGGPMFSALRSGDVLIAAKLDRLFRSALDALGVVERLGEMNVRLHLLDLGGDIAGSGLGKLFLTIVAAFAEAERDRLRERVSAVKADQRQKGRYLGGILPFGYRVEDGGLIPATDHFAIQEIRHLSRSGKTLRQIAREMDAKGVRISHAGVAKILRREDSAQAR